MRHLHILDPQLVDLGGHYFTYCALAVREMRRRGVPVSIYARRECQVLCEGVRPEPVFTRDIFLEAFSDPKIWAIENFHNVNQAFLAELCRIPADRFTADDVVFFPTILQNQLYAVAHWLGRLPAVRRPKVVVLLRYLNDRMDYVLQREHRELVGLYYRYAARTLLAVQPRTVFAVDTAEMAAAFHEMMGVPVHELPIAMDPPPLAAPRPTPPRPLVVFQGHASQLKGFHHLPAILEQCAGLPTAPRFAVQVQNRPAAIKNRLGPVLEWLDRFAAAQPDVLRLINGNLSGEAYAALLHEADLVLLPYATSYYGTCSSGVFAEAAALGKPIVVPASTVCARQARQYALGVVTAAECTGPALAAAVAEALAQLPALTVQAVEAAPRFRAEQSVEAFWTRLTALLQHEAKAAA